MIYSDIETHRAEVLTCGAGIELDCEFEMILAGMAVDVGIDGQAARTVGSRLSVLVACNALSGVSRAYVYYPSKLLFVTD